MDISSWTLDPGKFLSRADAERLRFTARERARHASARGRPIAVRNHFLIELGISTGLRVMEIAALQCGDLYFDGIAPCLHVRCGKGGKSRTVYLSSKFARCCRRFLRWKRRNGEPIGPDSPLIRSRDTGGHMTKRALQWSFKTCARRAGLSRRYSIHCLRHTYACFLLKASNWSLRLVQKQLGHARITTTQVYADVMLPEIQAALDRLDGESSATT